MYVSERGIDEEGDGGKAQFVIRRAMSRAEVADLQAHSELVDWLFSACNFFVRRSINQAQGVGQRLVMPVSPSGGQSIHSSTYYKYSKQKNR